MLAGLAAGEKNAAAQRLAGGVEIGVGRLDDRRVDAARPTCVEQGAERGLERSGRGIAHRTHSDSIAS